MAIASKEARETQYWLNLLIRSGYIMQNDILKDCEELI
jgi:four helix bundle protein